MLLDVGTKCSVAGVSPGVQCGLTLVRLRITGLLTQVIKTERPAAPRVKEASLTQIPMLRNQNLCTAGEEEMSNDPSKSNIFFLGFQHIAKEEVIYKGLQMIELDHYRKTCSTGFNTT